MEISHSGKEHPGKGSAPHKTTKASAPVEASAAARDESDLSEKQRRLRALYGKGGASPELPTPALGPKKHSGPRRLISENDILNMQRKHRPALTACYDRALKRDDSLAEMKAEVTVTIDDRGLVKSVTIMGVRDEELATCLRKNIRYWAFEPHGEQTFRFPIIFRGS